MTCQREGNIEDMQGAYRQRKIETESHFAVDVMGAVGDSPAILFPFRSIS